MDEYEDYTGGNYDSKLRSYDKVPGGRLLGQPDWRSQHYLRPLARENTVTTRRVLQRGRQNVRAAYDNTNMMYSQSKRGRGGSSQNM